MIDMSDMSNIFTGISYTPVILGNLFIAYSIFISHFGQERFPRKISLLLIVPLVIFDTILICGNLYDDTLFKRTQLDIIKNIKSEEAGLVESMKTIKNEIPSMLDDIKSIRTEADEFKRLTQTELAHSIETINNIDYNAKSINKYVQSSANKIALLIDFTKQDTTKIVSELGKTSGKIYNKIDDVKTSNRMDAFMAKNEQEDNIIMLSHRLTSNNNQINNSGLENSYSVNHTYMHSLRPCIGVHPTSSFSLMGC